MNLTIKTGLLFVFLAFGCQWAQGQGKDYKNSNFHIERRIDNLFSQMTVEEKVNQLISNIFNFPRRNRNGLSTRTMAQCFNDAGCLSGAFGCSR